MSTLFPAFDNMSTFNEFGPSDDAIYIVMILRVGDAWLVGVGKRAPHGFRCLC